MQKKIGLLLSLMLLMLSMSTIVFGEDMPRIYLYQETAEKMYHIGIIPNIYNRISEKPTSVEGNIILNNIDLDKEIQSYGLSNIPTDEEYIKAMLNILGYNNYGDDYIKKALEIKLISNSYLEKLNEVGYEFVNDDVTYLVFKALNCNVNGEKKYLIDKLMDSGKIELSEVYDNGLYRKSIDISMSGIVVNFGTGDYANYKDYSGNQWYGSVTDPNVDGKISTIEIYGDDLREYTIFLTKDQVVNEEKIIGKRVNFSGKRAMNYFGNGKLKSIKADSYTFSEDYSAFELVTLKGKLLPIGHINDVAGEQAFTFVDEKGISYTALMGLHELIDKKPAEGEMYMGSYNLMDYTNTDIEVRGLKSVDNNYIIVKEMGKEFSWNMETKSWKNRGVGYPGNTLIFFTVEEERPVVENNILLTGTFNTLYAYDDLEITVKFDKNVFGEKIPDSSFVGKTITVYYPEEAEIFSVNEIDASDWYYDNGNQTSASVLKFEKVLKTTDKYYEYQVIDKYNIVKVARLYKNDFAPEVFQSLIGKYKYVTGDIINGDLSKLWVKEMFK